MSLWVLNLIQINKFKNDSSKSVKCKRSCFLFIKNSQFSRWLVFVNVYVYKCLWFIWLLLNSSFPAVINITFESLQLSSSVSAALTVYFWVASNCDVLTHRLLQTFQTKRPFWLGFNLKLSQEVLSFRDINWTLNTKKKWQEVLWSISVKRRQLKQRSGEWFIVWMLQSFQNMLQHLQNWSITANIMPAFISAKVTLQLCDDAGGSADWFEKSPLFFLPNVT